MDILENALAWISLEPDIKPYRWYLGRNVTPMDQKDRAGGKMVQKRGRQPKDWSNCPHL